MSFQFIASNRHWVFAKQNILSPLNDQLAQRHGAQYTFEVPESSFDWDVEFSVIKDRSGNTLREQYMAAWVQPSLVAPGEKIYQLGARVNWRNPDVFGKNTQFNQNEIASLMSKVDEILGSPIKIEEKKETEEKLVEKPTSITNQKKETLTLSSVKRVIRIATELVGETSESKEVADLVFNAVKIVNNAKKLNSTDTQQLEIQDAYDQLNELNSSPSTALIGIIGVMICDKLRQGSIKDEDLYDILSRITRQILDSKNLIGKAADFKLKAIGDIEKSIMNLFNDTTVSQIETIYSDIEQEQLMIYLDKSLKQISELRDMSLKFDISDIPAPQVVEKYIEEIKENPTS